MKTKQKYKTLEDTRSREAMGGLSMPGRKSSGVFDFNKKGA